MTELILEHMEFPLRMLGAAFFGALVGYERESQMKAAGIRTHSIVALAACLMMLISKYSFYDVLSHTQISLDPSRIAAGVVTAIGFLGAGVIFTHKMNVTGLTTSAGLWATVGIGLSLGSGMYTVGIAATILILVLQITFHKNFRWLKSTSVEHITLLVKSQEEVRQILTTSFQSEKIKIHHMKASRASDSLLQIKLYVSFPDNYDVFRIMELLQENPQITSIDL